MACSSARSPRGRSTRTRTTRPNQDGGLGARTSQENLAKGHNLAGLLRLSESDFTKSLLLLLLLRRRRRRRLRLRLLVVVLVVPPVFHAGAWQPGRRPVACCGGGVLAGAPCGGTV